MSGAVPVFKNCLCFHMANDDEGGKGRNDDKTPVNPTAKLARRSPSVPLAAPPLGRAALDSPTTRLGHPPGESVAK